MPIFQPQKYWSGEYTGTGHDCERQSEKDWISMMKGVHKQLRKICVNWVFLRNLSTKTEIAISNKDSNPSRAKTIYR